MGDDGLGLVLGELEDGGGDLMLGFDDFMCIVESKGGEVEEREDLRRSFKVF
jgi:calcium-binding protein CML